jgi:hypothetical protein
MKNMTQNTNSIKGGVMIMGSLFWEDEKNCVKGNEKVGKERRIWRRNNLDLSQTKRIPLPIRYGRISSQNSRKSTYTMVLSREYLNHLGTALVVPFRNPFLINEKTKIREQVIKLAKVEGIQKTKKVKFARCWSAISIWINPNSQYLNQLRNYWLKNIIGKSTHAYSGKSYEWSDGTLLDNNFQLQLPIVSDSDFLLCTYILPKYENTQDYDDCNRTQNMQNDYPKAEKIGEAIAQSGYVTYFAENRVNGIVTSDDEEIFKHIPNIY